MEDEKKCKCNTQKEICKRMTNASLQQATKELKKLQADATTGSNDSAIVAVKSIINVVTVYECLPCENLKARAEMVLKEIGKENGFYKSHKVATEILVAEVEAFLQE